MTDKKNELVKVHLTVYKPIRGYPGQCTDYYVAVVGPVAQLGNEDPNLAARLNPADRNFWKRRMWLPKDKDVYFKILVVKAASNAVVDIEEIIPRRLYIGQKALIVEMAYNKSKLLVKEAVGEFKALQRGKYGMYHIPSLNIHRSDKAHKLPASEFNPPEKIVQQFIASFMNNSIGMHSLGQQWNDHNQNITQRAILQTDEVKPAIHDVEVESEQASAEQDVKFKEEIPVPFTKLLMKGSEEAFPNKANVKIPLTTHANHTTKAVRQKVDDVAIPVTHSADCTTQDTFKKEENVSNPSTKHDDCNAKEAHKKEVNITTKRNDYTSHEVIQKKENETYPLTQSIDFTRKDVIQKEGKVGSPPVKITNTKTLGEENVTHPQTQIDISTSLDPIQKDQKIQKTLKKPTNCLAQEAFQTEDNATKLVAKRSGTVSNISNRDSTKVKTDGRKQITDKDKADTKKVSGAISDKHEDVPRNKIGLFATGCLVATGVAFAAYQGYSLYSRM